MVKGCGFRSLGFWDPELCDEALGQLDVQRPMIGLDLASIKLRAFLFL